MKKIFLFLAACAMSTITYATVSITVNPNHVDFGEVSIKGKTSVEGSVALNVTYSGLQPYCGVVFEDVESEMPTEGATFWIEGTNTEGWIYGGDQYNPAEGQGLTLHYMADQAGTYTGKIRFYSYEDADWEIESTSVYLTMSLTVTSEAIVATTTPYVRVNSISELAAGDVVVFVNEGAGAVCGAINGTYLSAITEDVDINTTNHEAIIPEAAQTFTIAKNGSYWQFNAGSYLLGGSSTSLTSGTGTTDWTISIASGEATIAPKESSATIQYNSSAPRFKLYTSTQNPISLYKKSGEAAAVETTLEVETINFGEVEMGETAEVTVNYTATHMESEILWDITGTDAALFSVEANGNNTAGSLTIQYKGGATKSSVDAKVYALFTNASLDETDASFNIAISLVPTTIKLTNIAFVGAPTTIDQGQSIDMSQYVVLTPNDAADKSLSWATDHDYQGVVDANGVLTAKHVTGTITVTATSVRVPSVSASHTLTITVPTITDFTLSETETTMNIGGTKTLSITAFVPEYATASANFSSSNTDVATVNKNGVITAKAIGDAVITATIGEVEKSCTVHVVAVTVNSITFANEDINLTLGSSLLLTPTVDPAEAASQYTISYESDNEAVATVDADGKVTSVAVGDAVITATIDSKSAEITIHVVAAAMFAKVTDPSVLAAKDTIILATIYENHGVIAGPRGTDNAGKKKLSVLTEDVTVTETEAYADGACRLVLGTEKNQEGFTLTIGSKMIAVASSGNDIVDANTQNCKFWEFVADGNNGYYIRNLGNTNAMFKYHAGNAAVKPYKANTAGAVYVYAYYRKYVDPSSATGVEYIQPSEVSYQKVLRNGQVLIIRNGETYTITGMKVE
ncbi:MAG: Ig domain-containing protein [Paludibacteraceae bacterium]|nr:Ig domain-containing protein [Paludibacteraceae bacterium]MBQ8704750.1 Ig domain-containing protein [Paludibacteraceae bacterium]